MIKRPSGVITLPKFITESMDENKQGLEHIYFCFAYMAADGGLISDMRGVASRLIPKVKREYRPALKVIARFAQDHEVMSQINLLVKEKE